MKIGNFRNYIKYPLCFICYFISKVSILVKRDSGKWVFGCHTGFGDNSKFLLFHICKEHQELRPIWIAHKKRDVLKIRELGVECYYWLSIKGFYHAATAGVFVCTQSVKDVNRFVSEGAVYLNLNHGVGLKKGFWLNQLRMGKNYGKTADELEKSFFFKVINYIWLFRKPDLSLVTSDFQAREIFCPQFRIPLENCIYGNYPRNEILRKNETDVIRLVKEYEPPIALSFIDYCRKYRKVYIYMPTFRNDGSDFIADSCINFKRLNAALKDNNSLLVLKLHPQTQLNLSELTTMSNIVVFDRRCDIYFFLPFTDCLITDYSSIYCDYLLMNKEIILFPFDKEEYIKKCMDLADYDLYYRGQTAKSFETLYELIRDNTDCHLQKEDYEFVMNIFWNRIDNKSNIVNEVKNRLILKKR